MAEPLVAFERVEMRAASGRRLFGPLDWELPRGARIRLLGERSAGASQLLRLCAGVAEPAAGRVLLAGEPHTPDQFAHPYLRRGAVGWVPEDGGLLGNLTLLENLALPRRFVLGEARAAAGELALALLERIGLAEQAGLRPHVLARGDRQLAGLARSRLMATELWLLEGPFDRLEGRRLEAAVSLLDEALATPATTLVLAGAGPIERRLAPTALCFEEGELVSEERS